MKKLSILLLSMIAILSLSACQKQAPAEEPDSTLQGSDLNAYIEEGLTDEYRVSEIPDLFVQVHTLRGAVDPCPKEPDGPCGFDLGVYVEEDLQEGNQDFYFGTTAGGPMDFFGPFNDDVQNLVFE